MGRWDREGALKMLTLKVEAMCSQAEGCWQPLEAERDKEQILLQNLWGDAALLTPDLSLVILISDVRPPEL